jgi:hypothetical protein
MIFKQVMKKPYKVGLIGPIPILIRVAAYDTEIVSGLPLPLN